MTCALWPRITFGHREGDIYVEVWVETAGMAPQIQAVANEFGVRVIASGGFSSVTARRNTALRLVDKGTGRYRFANVQP